MKRRFQEIKPYLVEFVWSTEYDSLTLGKAEVARKSRTDLYRKKTVLKLVRTQKDDHASTEVACQYCRTRPVKR